MTEKLPVRHEEPIKQNLLPSEDQPKVKKTPQNYSEPLWKRNLGKTVRQKKIGEVARAKGGRY